MTRSPLRTRPPRRPAHSRAHGLTLVELLVVLALAAIILHSATLSFSGWLQRQHLLGVSAQFNADLQWLRSAAVLRSSAQVEKRMELVRGTSTMTQDAVMSRDLVLMGLIDGFRIWVVPKLDVLHEDGVTRRMVPDGTVIGVADAYFEGVRHFGAIEDVETA